MHLILIVFRLFTIKCKIGIGFFKGLLQEALKLNILFVSQTVGCIIALKKSENFIIVKVPKTATITKILDRRYF